MKKTTKRYSIITLAAALAATSIAIGVKATTLDASAAETVENSRFEMVEGASIRTVSPKGLRFIAEMGEDVYEELTTAEDGVVKKMGMYIVPVSYLNDSSKYSNGVLGVMEQSYNKITTKIDHVFYSSDGSVDNKIYQSGEYYRANGVISNLLLKNYDRDFIGIAYISETVGEKTTYSYADFNLEDNVRDSLYVATKAYEDYTDEAKRKVFNEYIMGAHLETLGMSETVVDGVKTGTYTYEGKIYNSIEDVSVAAGSGLTLTLDAQNIFITSMDETATLTATISDKAAPVTIDTYVMWESANDDVVTVDQNGKLSVAGSGETTVTASFMDQIATCKVSVFDGTFETMSAVPSALRSSNHAGTATIGEKDGDKCLVVPVTGSTPYLMVTRAFLADFFADQNVAYLAFDAKTKTLTTDNFRRYTMKADGSGMNYVHYEAQHDIAEFTTLDGVSSESWKTFYFSRTDYDHWVTNNVEENTLIYATGFTAGDEIYVDNIRPITEKEYTDDAYSFETGWVRLNNTNLLTYDSVGTIKQWQLGIGFNSADKAPTAYGMTNELSSHGNRSLSFTKPAGGGTYNIRINDVAHTTMKSTGYYAFDLYVPEGADATLSTPNTKSTTYPMAKPQAGAWTTVYVDNTNAKPINLDDTTGGTYAIDHFRSVSKAEYDAAAFGFEQGIVGIEDVISSQSRFFCHIGADYANSAKVWSLNVKGDGATLSDPHFNTENVHNGAYSLAFTKTDGYLFMSINSSSTMYAELKDGFTFWIYSTVTLNGETAKNIMNGNATDTDDAILNGGAGMTVPANTWTQITITASEMNSSGRFLQIQGSTAGTIYLDDFRPLGEDDSNEGGNEGGNEGDDVGGGEQEQEAYLTYNAEFDEVEGTLTLGESSYTGSGSTLPTNSTSVEEDMSYFAFNEKFGLNDFLVFDITGDNMPIISFFNNEVTKTIYNQEQDPNVRGWIIANGMTLSNGTLFGGVDGAHAKRYAVIGPNKIAYKFDNNGENEAVQYRYNTSSNDMPWGLSMATLQSTNDQYKVIIGFTAKDSTTVNLHIYALNMATGQTVANTTVAVRALYEEGYIAMHGHFGRTTVVDKVYPIEEDTTLQAIIDKYMPTTLVYNGAWDGEGGLVLGQSTYTGSVQAPATSDMSYIAFEGEYGVGDYVVFDFTGDNMPLVSFFNNTITNTAFNTAQDTSVKGWVIANGLRQSDGTIYGGATGIHASRLMAVGPYKIMHYTSDPTGMGQFRYNIGSATETSPSPISMNTLQSVQTTYRAIFGIEDGGSGYAKLRIYIINMDTLEVVLNRGDTLNNAKYSWSEGSIILYGQFYKETVLDKVFGVEENTNINTLITKYKVKDVDYSDEVASFDAYAYSGPNDGQWKLDGKNQVANPTDYRTLEQLTTYKNAGFNIYLAQDSITVDAATWETSADGKVIMDRARDAGLKVILTDSRIQDLSEPVTISGSTVKGEAWEIGGERFKNLAALDSYIANCLSLYKDHPAFYGVMLGDEPSYHNAYCYGEVYKAIKRVAPEVYVQYNLLPLNNNTDSIKYRYPNLANDNSISKTDIENAYVAYLEAFLDSMGVDYVQYDHYPMRSSTSLGIFTAPYIVETYLRGLQIVAGLAKERDLAVKIVAQTCVMRTSGKSSSIYLRQITENDARWLNNSLLGFGVKEINYFTYWTKQANYSTGEYYDDGGSFVKRDGTKTALYTFMQTIMKENQAFAGTIKNFDYMGSRLYTGSSYKFGKDHLTWLDNSYTFHRITSVTTSTDATLVTELYDSNRYNYMYMLMNTIDPSEGSTSQTIKVTFDVGCTKAYVYQNGVRTSVALTNNTYTVTLTAGQAVYVLPY